MKKEHPNAPLNDGRFVTIGFIIFIAAAMLDLAVIKCAQNNYQARTGGKIQVRMAKIKNKVEFELYKDPKLTAMGVDTLRVCCIGGSRREYYTCEMPWEFILYKFSGDIPTVTIFEINEKTREARFRVVVLDPSVETTDIKQSGILHYIKKLGDYMPGYNWQGDVRVEPF